eukprot:206446_1
MSLISLICIIFACSLRTNDGKLPNSKKKKNVKPKETITTKLQKLETNLCGRIEYRTQPPTLQYELAKQPQISLYDSYEPIAIIFATCQEDAATFIQFINSGNDDIKFRVRSGGHSVGGYSTCNKKK